MKNLLLTFLACAWAAGAWCANGYKAFTSVDNYKNGNSAGELDVKFKKRSGASLTFAGGGTYSINVSKLDSVQMVLARDSTLLLERGDELLLNCRKLRRNNRFGYAPAILLDSILVFEAHMRAEEYTQRGNKFALTAEGEEGIVGSMIRAHELLTIYIFNPVTRMVRSMSVDDFTNLVKQLPPDMLDKYAEQAKKQKHIERLEPPTVWPYLKALKNNTKQ